MIKRCFIGNIFLLIGISISSLWALSGTLKDNNNNPLAGADVFLINKNIRDTTDAAGAFSFSALPIKNKAGTQIRFTKPVLSDKGIFFSLDKSGIVEYAIYTIKGAKISHNRNSMDQGNHFLPLVKDNNSLANGVYVIKFRADGLVTIFRYNSVNKNRFRGNYLSKQVQNELTTAALNKASTAALTVVDTLIISKIVGDVTSTRKIRVYDYADDINSANYVPSGMQIVILDPSNDNDGDGLTNFEERYLYNTNEELFDTDGDGMGDKSEIVEKKDPLIASFPTVTFAPRSNPIIVANFSKSINTDTSRDISFGGDYSSSSGFTSQQQVNASASIAVMVGGEISKEPKLSGSITGTVGAGWSMTWGTDQSQSVGNNWNSAESYTKSHGLTINGGRVKIDIELINNSDQNITLVNPMIRLSSTDFGASTISTQIGELTLFTGDGISGDNEVIISCAPGQNSFIRQFGINLSNPDVIEHLAQNACGLKAQLTNIRFRKSAAEVDSLMDNIYRRTAEVIVDFGQAIAPPNNLIKKRAASISVYNDFYTSQTDRHISASLFDLIKAVGANPVIGVDSGNTGITEINGVKNGTLRNGIWSIVCQITPDSLQIYSTKLSSYDPKTINVGKTTVISCVYDSDIDGDGVPTRVESVLGTDDTKIDTDGDGIADKDEFMGWKRASDSTGVIWKTNPRLKDTDNDSLEDYIDPDPLTPVINPLDSAVIFKEITLTPLQGTKWTDTTIADSMTSIPVNQIMRGPTLLTMKLANPVFLAFVICNGKDTVARMNRPDTSVVTLKLNLGTNDIQVVAISRNQFCTKKISLTGIDRRLARVDNFNRSLFYLSDISIDKLGIEAGYYINADSIRKMDPLIDHIVVARTSIYGIEFSAADSANKICANDLGDAGNGTSISTAYKILEGLDGIKNQYTITSYLPISDALSKVYYDDSLTHPNDYSYFLYTANTGRSDGQYYYSAPLTSKGNYFANERTIVVDTVIRFIGCDLLWGSSSPWNVSVGMRADLGFFDAGTTSASLGKSDIAKNIWSGSREMVPGNWVFLTGQFDVDYFLGSYHKWSMPFITDGTSYWNDAFTYAQIISPFSKTEMCFTPNVSGAESITLNYSPVSYTGFNVKCWNFIMNDGVYNNHTGGVWVHWRYKYNDIRHDW